MEMKLPIEVLLRGWEMKTTVNLVLVGVMLGIAPAALCNPESPGTAPDGKAADRMQSSRADSPESGTTGSAWKWSTLSSRADAIEREIKDGLLTGKMKAIEAIEFRSDLKRMKTHLTALKPRNDVLGFSQYLVLERDISDLRAQVDMVKHSTLKPGQNVEQAKAEFVGAMKQALEKKQIAQSDADKLLVEVREQDDLYRALKPSGAAILPKDAEVLLKNFAGLHVALQQRIKFSRDSISRLEEHRKLIEQKLQSVESAGNITEDKAVQYRSALSKIAGQQMDLVSKGPLSASQIVVIAMQLDGVSDLIARKGDAISQQTASTKSGVK
jgi:hypothetical protein